MKVFFLRVLTYIGMFVASALLFFLAGFIAGIISKAFILGFNLW